MDPIRTGALIRKLRNENGMTQKVLAGKIGVSEQAVSKWERGLGCPDVSLLRDLARVLDVDVRCLLSGIISQDDKDGGNMRRIRFYVCPQCGNVITMTGSAQVSCCSRVLEPLAPVPYDHDHAIRLQDVDGETYITFEHGMEKEHHIRFVACVGYDRVLLVRLYPEQGSELRMPYMPRGTYYVMCSRDGLFMCKK